MTFSFTITIMIQFALLIVCFFVLFRIKIFLTKMGNLYLFEKVNKTDTSLYFLTVEKVAVSLPTKCLSNPTNG